METNRNNHDINVFRGIVRTLSDISVIPNDSCTALSRRKKHFRIRLSYSGKSCYIEFFTSSFFTRRAITHKQYCIILPEILKAEKHIFYNSMSSKRNWYITTLHL